MRIESQKDDRPRAAERLFGLDVLRAAAILFVLIAHTWPSREGGNWPNVVGVFGVELFFVLSGYLIGGILLRLADANRLGSWQDLVNFWRRRWFRTLPNYYLFLGLHLAWQSWVLGFPDVITNQWEFLFFIQNFNHGPSFFFPETWSLAIEEWFYLLFPLCLWAAFGLFRQQWKAWLLVTGAFLAIPFVLRIWAAMHVMSALPSSADAGAFQRSWDMTFRRTVMLRLDVVIYGVVASLIAARQPEWWRRGAKFWPVGLILIAIGASSLALDFPLDRGRPFGGLLLFPCFGVGLALLLPYFSVMRDRAGLCADGVRVVARLSYALYLCHGLVLLALPKIFGRHALFTITKQTWSWCLSGWVLFFAVAWAVHRYFEKPIMDLRDQVSPPFYRRLSILAHTKLSLVRWTKR